MKVYFWRVRQLDVIALTIRQSRDKILNLDSEITIHPLMENTK